MKYVIVLWFAVMASVNISAQTNADHKPKQKQSPTELAQEYADGLTKTLNLTPAQSKALLKAATKYEKEVASIEKSNLTNAQKYDKLFVLRTGRSNTLKELLTKDQYRKYTLLFP